LQHQIRTNDPMDRRFSSFNRSNSNNSDSSDSYSLSSFNSKISRITDSSYSCYTSHQLSKNPKIDTSTYKKMSTRSRIQRRNPASVDRLAVTIHNCDSDHKRRRARADLDRQLSVSRWIADADAVTKKCSKLRRASTSHDSLLSIPTKRPLDPRMEKTRQNIRFGVFQPVDSKGSMSKPVRKRSSGPDALLKDALLVLRGEGKGDISQSPRRVRRPLPSTMEGMPFCLDEGDIEEESEHDYEESHRILSTAGNNTKDPSTQAPLLAGRLRWDASSPSQSDFSLKESVLQQLQEQEVTHVDGILSHSRCSSKKMPVPPPPPFSPVKSRNAIGEVPNGFFQPGPEPIEDVRESLNLNSSRQLAPVAAASAAIAIATGSMDNEEEACLNDLVKTPRERKVLRDTSLNSSDAALGDNIGYNWNDSGISNDISLVSASNASATFLTHRSSRHVVHRKEDDYSHKSIAEYTLESGYSSNDDRHDIPAVRNTLCVPLKAASDQQARHIHNDLQALSIPKINKNRCSLSEHFSNHGPSSTNQRYRRPRRASVDSSDTSTSWKDMNQTYRQPRRASADTSGASTNDANLSPRSRQKTISLFQSFLTPTRLKTPRTSPSVSIRKRLGNSQPSASPHQAPSSWNNPPAAPPLLQCESIHE